MKSRTLMFMVGTLVVAITVWSNSPWAKSDVTELQQVSTVVRTQAIELVDKRGQVRSRLNVEPSGDVLLRFFDEKGTIRVKLGASEGGSGLLLMDEATEPAIHLIARRTTTAEKPTPTSITLRDTNGQPRVIKP